MNKLNVGYLTRTMFETKINLNWKTKTKV